MMQTDIMRNVAGTEKRSSTGSALISAERDIACGIINDETFEIVGKDACAFFRGQSAEKTAQCMAELAKNTAARCGTDFQQIENRRRLHTGKHRCAERNGC